MSQQTLRKVRHFWSQPLPKIFTALVTACCCLVVMERYLTVPDKTLKHRDDDGQQPNKTNSHWLHSLFRKGKSGNPLTINEESERLGCVFPDVDPYSPGIMKLAGLDKKPLRCDRYMPDITYVNQNTLTVNRSRIKNEIMFKFCKYRDIFKNGTDDKKALFGAWSEPFDTSVKLPDTTEFIVVECENKAKETISRTYHALVPIHKELTKLKLKKRRISGVKETLNVIMIGMDGLSRHQYMRSMNLTYNFLMKGLNSFDMSMHTQVGINTFPNFLPLLTGYNLSEVEKWWTWSENTDEFDLIWKDYHKQGYRTLYTEDQPIIGGFHFEKPGFMFKPTMYYSRPISLAMEADRELWRSGPHCAGNEPEIQFHLNYIERFFDTFPDTPLYAMSFLTKLTHNDMTNSKMADEMMYTFYKSLQEKGHLNNTLLLTFSDHGPRLGLIRPTVNGMVESRAPYSIFTFPRWFLDKYPEVTKNLKINTRRLTTHFDTHATLHDLLYFKVKDKCPPSNNKHGVSLFQEIPKSRTCEDIPIPLEFCLCNQVQMEPTNPRANISKGFSKIILHAINTKRNETVCTRLQLKEILQVVQIKLPSLGSDDKMVYKVKIQTNPGDAIYEGTIQTTLTQDENIMTYVEEFLSGGGNKKFIVGETIDRLNLYKGQADCEKNDARKPYCYCKDLITS
ncbi:uncharacterized protein LOC131944366 [Physella acuta]|uniref:uncharacterized protein LOC131944366 n=1 Tax=Physella acuta TaxID=109671 RepID=UPI0027DC73A2|nr:uncharacterized protein LOC131944366 [Physella acuta]